MSLDSYVKPRDEEAAEQSLAALMRPHTARQRLRPVAALDVALRNGDRIGLPYALFMFARLRRNGDAPEAHVEILFTTHRLRIFGRSLTDIYQFILLNLVSCIEESEGAEPENAAYWVDRIEVEEFEKGLA